MSKPIEENRIYHECGVDLVTAMTKEVSVAVSNQGVVRLWMLNDEVGIPPEVIAAAGIQDELSSTSVGRTATGTYIVCVFTKVEPRERPVIIKLSEHNALEDVIARYPTLLDKKGNMLVGSASAKSA